LLNFLTQRLTISSAHFSLDGLKGRLQGGEVMNLLVGDMLRTGGHSLHEV
jgi:hypothetical protein